MSVITLHPRKKNGNFFIFVVNGNQTVISQINKVIGLLEEKLDFFSSSGLEAGTKFGHRTSKLKPHPFRASERYINEKNPIFDQETASIVRFSPGFSAENFESDFNKNEFLLD